MKYGIARATNTYQLERQCQLLEQYGCDEIRQYLGASDDTHQVFDTIKKMVEGDELVALTPNCLFRNSEK